MAITSATSTRRSRILWFLALYLAGAAATALAVYGLRFLIRL